MKKKINTNGLFNDISQLIERARQHVSRNFNVTHGLLSWHIGNRINIEILKENRAGYGMQVISHLSIELRAKYGPGYDKSALFRMVKFSKLYPDSKIVATMSQQLGWSHIVQLIAITDGLKRNFYTEMCKMEGWDIRTLRSKINSMLFERTALAKKPDKLIKQELEKLHKDQTITPDFIFHDPCFLNFTGLQPNHSETDLENAILDELTYFLQEFGNDFCFVARWNEEFFRYCLEFQSIFS